MGSLITSLDPVVLIAIAMLVFVLLPLILVFWHFYRMDEAELLRELREHPDSTGISDHA